MRYRARFRQALATPGAIIAPMSALMAHPQGMARRTVSADAIERWAKLVNPDSAGFWPVLLTLHGC
ncbi:MAG: hypothetical protein CMQ61_09025 [Gammaproteobacteria bacterium]|nr:hypothetical protein [Gammaproteobacteria bacterium]